MFSKALPWLARVGLLALLAMSLVSALWAGREIARNPLLRPVIERSAQEFAAALDRELARTATPEVFSARLTELLAEAPRNWIAIDAVMLVADERGLPLPGETKAARDAAWEEDTSLLTMAGACLTCMVDATQCSLSEALACNAPVTLTPIGDVIGIGKAGVASLMGYEVDRLDLALSAIGLGATVAVVATGGTSYTLKVGASLLKLSRKMTLIPPRLMGMIADAARTGIRWDEALRWDRLSDPARLIVPEVVAPLAAVASDLGRIDGVLGTSRTLHLLQHIDGPNDARRLAMASEAMGPRALGTIEILGKARFMRAAIRLSDVALNLMAGLIGMAVVLGTALGSALQWLLTRQLRRALKSRSR